MGKKKANQSDASTPEGLKDLGNAAFSAGDYKQAIECYTAAINMAMKAGPDTRPNHLFFSNRANAKLQLKEYEGCLEDAKIAVYLDGTHVKSYLRGAYAHYYLHQLQ